MTSSLGCDTVDKPREIMVFIHRIHKAWSRGILGRDKRILKIFLLSCPKMPRIYARSRLYEFGVYAINSAALDDGSYYRIPEPQLKMTNHAHVTRRNNDGNPSQTS